MHRSGTSAVTRVINSLGAKLADELMSPESDNETGFWESAAVTGLNEEILASAGSRWDDWRQFNPEWFHSPVAHEFAERALDILARDVGHSCFFALKDPRICRLLPFWANVFHRFDTQIKCILPIRNPLEVAASLRARDGFAMPKSTLLWLRHVLDAEATTRELPRVFVSYEALLSDWRWEARRIATVLDLVWPRFSAETEREIDQFLDAGHRHHHIPHEMTVNHPGLPEWVKVTATALLVLCREEGQKDHLEQLEKVRAEFDGACKNLGAALHEEDAALTTKADELEDRLSNAQSRLAEFDATSREQEQRIAALEAGYADALREQERLTKILQEKEAETDRIKAALEAKYTDALQKKERQLTDAQNEAEHYKDERDRLSQKLDERIRELVRFTKILQEKEAETDRIEAARQAMGRLLGKTIMALLEYSPGEPLGRRRQKRLVARLRESGTFDEDWYLEKYPDVIQTGMDPALHYLMHGALEGREPQDASRKVVQRLGMPA